MASRLNLFWWNGIGIAVVGIATRCTFIGNAELTATRACGRLAVGNGLALGVLLGRGDGPADARGSGFRIDCVAKLFFGVCAKFSRGAGARAQKLCEGSHDRSDFQPAAFVSSSQGM